MFKSIFKAIATIAIALTFVLETTLTPVFAQELIPHPDKPFTGNIGLTFKDSTADKPELKLPANYGIENAPNILLVLIDDVGYGQFGTFGGAVSTPTLDKIAKNGLRYTQFHTTALCSPTRAALLTGRNHHSVGTGVIQEVATGFPGYSGIIPKSAAPFSKILQDYGYATAWFGKNHNVPDWETSMAGPFEHWPNAQGFDYFYGFVGGDTDQYTPSLVENTTRLEAPKTNADGSPYHLTTDLADHAINYIRQVHAISPDKPFFAYLATGATHAPHQVPEKWSDQFKGQFDIGWDKYREETFERQKKLGVIPQDAQLTPRPKELPAWDSLTPKEQKVYARMAEIFAGFTAQTDYEVGRVVQAIDDLGILDNTIVFYIAGDNGSSAEGGLEGLLNENTFFNALPEDLETKLAAVDDLGGPKYFNHFPAAWAWAMDTPFQWTKQVASHFGGTRNAMAVSWPARIKDKGATRYQFSHIIDIAPTILEAIGIQPPVEVNGIGQKPIEGTSLVYTFDDANAKTRHNTQYFEMLGNQGIYHDGWMASALNSIPWDPTPSNKDLLHLDWELYHIDEDFTQAVDLAADMPDKLQEMKDLFYAQAAKYDVLPLDARKTERFRVDLRPSLTEGRTTFSYPDHLRITEGSAPDVKHKNHTITADVIIPDNGTEGVLMTHGGRFGGYGLYIKDGKLVYSYNLADTAHYDVVSTESIPTGKVKLKAVYKTDADEPFAGGNVTLYANNRKIGSGRVEKTLPNRLSIDETFDVGFDTGTPVTEAYETPFDFTGNLDQVTINLDS
ncbi:sulfatase [Crocosphaera subtropica ATCC 51142]|uniref:Sulfatase n=1 Tax=Crocosphaera subtropica (strain ATCC 51142 / BH68) TaxID=43989 RepID=B1WP17_CROS5|nr:arylsulfatase [Crocosphaera subtropica]ACB53196.1 sulfatase [Crocosphaera subtropica ATCC 51142]